MHCYGHRFVILVGLTGGIGAGKSTVSSLLAERGAVVIDADAVTKELQQPGQPVLAAIVERFGHRVLQPDGTLDRAGLAAIVFPDPDALTELNAIVHPAVGKEINRRIEVERDTEHVVVLDVPLLVETGRRGMGGVIVVDVDPEIAVGRLVAHRGFTEADARARIARQASRADRLAKADRVIDNGGTPDDLRPQVDELWSWVLTLPPVPAPET